jgi:hypothetical protein
MTKKINIHFSPEELKALVTLADNQMFRMKFIDPKMPGYKISPEAFRAAQSAVGLLHEASAKENGYEVKPVKVASSGFGS